MTDLSICPGCGARAFSAHYVLLNQPVILNYRFASAAAASAVPRRDIKLAQCNGCGLVFNRSFDSSVVPYDENYENRQCYSAAFQTHLRELARHLISDARLKNGRILEVGCGKGDFLRLLCAEADAHGVGYDTTYEGPQLCDNPQLRFYKEYVQASDIKATYDAVICRHVIEHVPQIGDFLRQLHAIARAAGNPIVTLETPSFEWIVQNGCFWDIFYEHCNYFNLSTLSFLSERAGFEVLDQTVVFGGQYQLLNLRALPIPSAPKTAIKISGETSLATLAENAENLRNRLEKRLSENEAAAGWAIWGAGAKGVALVNQLRTLPPMFVIDSNPAKAGGVIPGSSIPIIGPADSRINQARLILAANPNYLPEIELALKKVGFTNRILST